MLNMEPEPMLITRPIGKAHKVLFPCGLVIFSHWYTHPWLSPNGHVRKSPASTKAEIAAMESQYRLQFPSVK